MRIYRLQGVHCRDCGDRLTFKLQNLEHGQDAQIDYRSNELTISDQMDEDQVK